jgi:hypothetical protein
MRWDFFVSCAESDRAWGEWIAWSLEERGHRVNLRAWESAPGANVVHGLHEAVRLSARTLAVISPAYLRGEGVLTEWGAAWRADPLGLRRSLLPIRVEECAPEGLLRDIRCVDLVGLGVEVARERLMGEIEASLRGARARIPRRPLFP